MEELCIHTREEFYLELIAKELTGEISETDKSALRHWMIAMKDNHRIMASPLLCLYQNFIGG